MPQLDDHYDLCIIGGGINGAGIARDAAGRGLKVILLEQNDFASGTSSASSKMIHGGLRYLEFLEFGLVKKSLSEREVLLFIAPQIVKVLKFCIPHINAPRPRWVVRLGLFFYDYLAGRKVIPSSGHISLQNNPMGTALKTPKIAGFYYHDCWVDDARLVILNLLDAYQRGATILNYTQVTKLDQDHNIWHIHMKSNQELAEEKIISAKAVINATGPSVHKFLDQMNLLQNRTPQLTLVQGSHIIVPRIYEGDHAYLLQLPDQRVIFLFPYGPYNLCGTTETKYEGDPEKVKVTTAERVYLCNALNQFFTKQTNPEDIIAEYCGVRPLFQAPQSNSPKDVRKISRDYHIDRYGDVDRSPSPKVPPPPVLLSIFGGKITTYRILAEEVMSMIKGEFPNMPGNWTANTPLPTCPFPLAEESNIDRLTSEEIDKYTRYFTTIEWAQKPEDILYRRTKWGIFARPDIKQKIAQMLSQRTTKN